MKTRENKRMIKLYFFLLPKLPFLGVCIYIYIYILAYLLFGAWSFLLVHIRSTPSEGPNDFVN
jgi:ABC-type sugar transport system permease subunit